MAIFNSYVSLPEGTISLQISTDFTGHVREFCSSLFRKNCFFESAHRRLVDHPMSLEKKRSIDIHSQAAQAQQHWEHKAPGHRCCFPANSWTKWTARKTTCFFCHVGHWRPHNSSDSTVFNWKLRVVKLLGVYWWKYQHLGWNFSENQLLITPKFDTLSSLSNRI